MSPRKQRQRQRLRLLALARARALGCDCDATIELFLLPLGPAARVKHERGCRRWEAIRPDDGCDLVTGMLHPSREGDAA
jgi:hypothetical protein